MQAKDEGGEAVTEEVWKGSLGPATSLGLLGGPDDFFFSVTVKWAESMARTSQMGRYHTRLAQRR